MRFWAFFLAATLAVAGSAAQARELTQGPLDNPKALGNPCDQNSCEAKAADRIAKASDPIAKASDRIAKASDPIDLKTRKLTQCPECIAKASDPIAKAADRYAKASDPIAKASDRIAKASDRIDLKTRKLTHAPCLAPWCCPGC